MSSCCWTKAIVKFGTVMGRGIWNRVVYACVYITYICIWSLCIRPSHTAAIWASEAHTSRDVFESIPAEYDWLIEYPTRAAIRTLCKLKSDWSSFSRNFDSCLAATNCAVRLYRDIEYSMGLPVWFASVLLVVFLCLLFFLHLLFSLSLSLLISFSHRYWLSFH